MYSAGAMKGLPFNYNTNDLLPITDENISFITLLNDNINKIPRDLSEVGPQDKTFRSSVELYGRVQNTLTSNEQFYPGRRSFTTSSIEDLFGLFDVADFTDSFTEPIPITNTLNAFHGFYKSDSDPFVAEITTSQNSNFQFGVNNNVTIQTGTASATNVANEVTLDVTGNSGVIEIGSIITSINSTPVVGTVDYVVINTTGDLNPTLTLNRKITTSPGDSLAFSLKTYNNINTLAVFETAPVVSRLDIFWETSSAGLITDLNNIILNSSSAGANFSSFNDQPFAENNTFSPTTNILSQNFGLLDNVGNPVVFGASDTFVLNSVFDQTPITPINRTSSFTLYEPTPGSNLYNIKVTQDFVDNIYFGDSPGSNDFDFSFTSVIDGVTTNYNQVARLSNVDPVMSGPNNSGTTPTPAIDYSTNASTFPSDIGTFTAVNGANAAGNQGRDITWSVTAEKGGVDFSASFGVLVSQTTTLSTCVLKNVNTSAVPAGTYIIKLKCIDAGNAEQEITITAQLGVIPVSVTDIAFTYNTGTPELPGPNSTSYACVIEVDNNPEIPAGINGFYLLNNSFAGVSSGVNTITLKQVNNCPGPWFYSATSLVDAFNNWKNCFTNEFPQSRVDTPVSSSTYLAKGFEVVS